MGGILYNPVSGGLPLGLPGVASPTRYVGRYDGGAPPNGSGPFEVGDFTVDESTPAIWVCQVAGTPPTATFAEIGGGGGAVSSVTAGDGTLTISPTTGAVVAAVGAIAQSKVTGLAAALALLAPLASPTFTGTPTVPTYAKLASPALTGAPTAPTQTAKSANTDIATTAYVDAAVKLRVTPTFGSAGVQAVRTGQGRWYAPYACTIIGVVASLGTAPTGASFIVDVLKNGTTIYTGGTNRPTITAAAFVSALPVVAPAVTALAQGDYITVNVSQIGSSVAGSDLTVAVLIY